MTSATITNTAAPRTATVEMKTFLITGGAGFLGINLTRLSAGARPQGRLRSTWPTSPTRSAREITEIKGDIRDKSIVDQAMQGT
jgi:nucleoside-diphosphate-sugar epimerase